MRDVSRDQSSESSWQILTLLVFGILSRLGKVGLPEGVDP